MYVISGEGGIPHFNAVRSKYQFLFLRSFRSESKYLLFSSYASNLPIMDDKLPFLLPAAHQPVGGRGIYLTNFVSLVALFTGRFYTKKRELNIAVACLLYILAE